MRGYAYFTGYIALIEAHFKQFFKFHHRRFCCDSCSNEWFSRQRIFFRCRWRNDDIGEVMIDTWKEQCRKCKWEPDHSEDNANWYPPHYEIEAIQRAMGFAARRIMEIYYGLLPPLPGPRIPRPMPAHERNLCEGCINGCCLLNG